MEKVIRDGKVAVIYSAGFGAGWYSWNTEKPWMMFHPELVALIETGKSGPELWKSVSETASRIAKELGEEEPYTGGVDGLRIEWVRQGAQFEIAEYDGSESVKVVEDSTYITA